MGRIVGVTLLLLAGYLYYSVYRYFRGGGEFRLRSRWMVLFAGVNSGYHWLTSHLPGHRHEHQPQMAPQEFGAVSAFSIGMIHGIGAETGTQVLVIATAVGAASKIAGVVALLSFVAGLLVSNLLITIASTAGFASVQRRQTIYVGIGLVAATFSLILGLLFIFAVDGRLPSLDPIVSWIGGPEE
jgi:high-affinity nickel-transport protein